MTPTERAEMLLAAWVTMSANPDGRSVAIGQVAEMLSERDESLADWKAVNRALDEARAVIADLRRGL